MSLAFKRNIGLSVVLLASVIPFLRWLFIAPLAFRFSDTGSITTSLGQIAGLTGLTLFSLNLILSSRLRFFDDFFYGLDRMYDLHKKLGVIGFSLILFHPLLLAVSYIQISLRSAALFLLPGSNTGLNLGFIALLLLIALVVITFYSAWKYHNWKLSHKFMIGMFIFALLHSFAVGTDISRDLFLKYYLLALSILGLVLSFFHSFLGHFFHAGLSYKVVGVKRLNDKIVEIELTPERKALKFLPGQFIFISFQSSQVSEETHPFSIVSIPSEAKLRLVVKSLGDFTDTLKDLKTGTLARITGPYGKFSIANMPGKNQVWVAGGIGITPFLSLAKDLPEDYKIDLYYCVYNTAEAVLIDELNSIRATRSDFRLFPWYSEEKGRINGEIISNLSGGLEGKGILLCGPDLFMADLSRQFKKLNVPRHNIYFENFKILLKKQLVPRYSFLG